MNHLRSIPFVLCLFGVWIGFVSAQTELTPDLFYAGIQNGDFDAVIDVRSETEWTTVGHIDNATLVPNLASTGTPDSILGCSNCTIAVYCQSGNRARQAINRLKSDFGFTGTLFNGLGVSQWSGAGYPLVNTDSEDAPCASSECELCSACETEAPTDNDDDNGSGARGTVDRSGCMFLLLSVLGAWFI
jgi:rhodanese-related sulfurtransferase